MNPDDRNRLGVALVSLHSSERLQDELSRALPELLRSTPTIAPLRSDAPYRSKLQALVHHFASEHLAPLLRNLVLNDSSLVLLNITTRATAPPSRVTDFRPDPIALREPSLREHVHNILDTVVRPGPAGYGALELHALAQRSTAVDVTGQSRHARIPIVVFSPPQQFQGDGIFVHAESGTRRCALIAAVDDVDELAASLRRLIDEWTAHAPVLDSDPDATSLTKGTDCVAYARYMQALLRAEGGVPAFSFSTFAVTDPLTNVALGTVMLYSTAELDTILRVGHLAVSHTFQFLNAIYKMERESRDYGRGVSDAVSFIRHEASKTSMRLRGHTESLADLVGALSGRLDRMSVRSRLEALLSGVRSLQFHHDAIIAVVEALDREQPVSQRWYSINDLLAALPRLPNKLTDINPEVSEGCSELPPTLTAIVIELVRNGANRTARERPVIDLRVTLRDATFEVAVRSDSYRGRVTDEALAFLNGVDPKIPVTTSEPEHVGQRGGRLMKRLAFLHGGNIRWSVLAADGTHAPLVQAVCEFPARAEGPAMEVPGGAKTGDLRG